MRKTALVFGIKSYIYSKQLSNPINDAKSVSDSLRKLGFEVSVFYDEDYKGMNAHIDEWYKTIDYYDVALFYYSGHGLEYEGENYILPTDSDPKNPDDLHRIAVSANSLLTNMESNKSRINIMILDACRDNPFLKSWTRSVGTGLVTMNGEGGSFVGYAAGVGKVARDGNNRNGIYTESILKYITKPNTSINDIFTLINNDVRVKTFNAQIPYITSSLSKPFCFNPEDRISFLNTKKANILQSQSNFLLTKDGELFFKKENDRLVVQMTKNYNIITVKEYNNVRPYKMISGTNSVYVIDTISNKLFILDNKKLSVRSVTQLEFKPDAFTIDNKENNVFILNNSANDSSSIKIYDLSQGKKVKSVVIPGKVGAISISSDNKTLYAISSNLSKRKGLYKIDYESSNKIDFIDGVACGQAIGIYNSNRSVFTSNTNLDGVDQINIIEPETEKVIKTLNFKALSFYFTYDKKYVMALGEREILLINMQNHEYLNTIKFNTKIGGVSLTENNFVFTFLPAENRIYSFPLSERLKDDSLETTAYKLKKIQDKVESKKLTDPQFIVNGVLTQANEIAYNTAYQLAYKLGGSFEAYSPDYRGPNFLTGTLLFHMYIRMKSDISKSINAYINVQVDRTNFVITIEEGETRKAYSSLNRSIDWNKVSDLINNFYIDRFSELGL